MKKLNITKEHFEKSKYYQNKYGKLAFVSESGELFKTEIGNILKFVEAKSSTHDDIDDSMEQDIEDNGLSKLADKPTVFANFDELKDYIEGCVYDKKIGGSINGDGRLGSNIDEARIISWLKTIFKGTNVSVEKPENRAWADVVLKIGDKSYYTNIKTTRGGGDNISSNEGVLYYLTGKIGSFKEVLRIQQPLTLTTTTDETVDYFLLVMFKNTRQVIFTSLGRLTKLYPNSSNPPFQIPWSNKDNREGTSVRDPIEQRKYVASVWLQSLSAGANKLDYFRDQLNNFINFSNHKRR